jgi:biopolymer transport protein ExbD
MAFGKPQSSGSTTPMAEINMVPLIDVMLVLLVIFILTAPLLTNAVKINLPQASSHENQPPPRRIEIALTPDAQIFINGEKIANDTLAERLRTISNPAAGDTPELQLRADKATPYEAVAKIMAAASQAGLSKIAFISQPE